MIGMTRAAATLLAAAVAGLLIWTATQVGDEATGGYWAEYGILAAAGLVLGLSQLAGATRNTGRPLLSLPTLALAFLPVLIVVAWIAAFHQPHANWFRTHVVNWSGDVGVAGFVNDLTDMIGVLTFGLGVVLGFCLVTTGARRAVEPGAPLDRRAADEPLTPERDVVESRPREPTPLATTPAGREPDVEPAPHEGPPA